MVRVGTGLRAGETMVSWAPERRWLGGAPACARETMVRRPPFHSLMRSPHEVKKIGRRRTATGVLAGLKSLFHKLETYGGQCLQIPVFTGMTGYGAVLRVDGKNDVANRRAVYGPTPETRLLKQTLETRHYDTGDSAYFQRNDSRRGWGYARSCVNGSIPCGPRRRRI